MKFARLSEGKRKPVRLPLVGMIDVFFLLLVYFIVSTTLAMPEDELSAALRQESKESTASDLQPQLVHVQAGGTAPVYIVGNQHLATQNQLRELLAKLPKEAGVFLSVDDSAPVWAAAAALQACHDAGYEKLTYVTPE
jgi:biopolymer transport protein ExbD